MFTGHSLERVADKHLSGGIKRRVGRDDVVRIGLPHVSSPGQIGESNWRDAEGCGGCSARSRSQSSASKTRFHLRQKRGLDRDVQSDRRFAKPAAAVSRGRPRTDPRRSGRVRRSFAQLISRLDEEDAVWSIQAAAIHDERSPLDELLGTQLLRRILNASNRAAGAAISSGGRSRTAYGRG